MKGHASSWASAVPDVEFDSVNDMARSNSHYLLHRWLPDGRLTGDEYEALNPRRNDQHVGSFKVNVVTGRWADFATEECGGDLISLAAYIFNTNQVAAARRVVSELGMELPVNSLIKIDTHSIPVAANTNIRQGVQFDPGEDKIVLPVPAGSTAPIRHQPLGPYTVRWAYRNHGGELLGYAARWDIASPDGSAKKEIRYQTYWEQSGWQWKPWPEPRPLYGLDDLARRAEAPILIVEGEKAAEAAAKLFPDYVAVTWPGGAKAMGKADWTTLAGRDVTIWPDNDDAGQQAATAVQKAVAGIASMTRKVILPNGWPAGWDVADELPADTTLDDLKGLLQCAVSCMSTLAAADAWSEPEVLPTIPAVAPFDTRLLPSSFRPWIEDIAERVQCPIDFPAVAATIGLGAAAGCKVRIYPKRQDDWFEVPNLWGAIIGRPGIMKSPAVTAALKPLKLIEAKAAEDYGLAISEWKSRSELAELKRKIAKDNAMKLLRKGKEAIIEAIADEPEPGQRRLIVNDATVQALGEILRANPNGVLTYRDELVSLLKSLDREGNEDARGFYLTSWAGKDPYTFDRIGRGLNLRIDVCCLSLLGTTQPAVISSYLSEAVAMGGGDGLLARFGMLVWPDVSSSWTNVDRFPDSKAADAAMGVFQRLDQLADVAFRFDNTAQDVFEDWRSALEMRLRSGEEHPALESHLSKYRKLVPSLALLAELAEGENTSVGEGAIKKALGWAEYLESHARRAYSGVTGMNVASARLLLNRIQKKDIDDGFTEREVYHKQWAGLGVQQVGLAAKTLEEYGYVKAEPKHAGARGGRPSVVWRVHPKYAA